MVAWAHIVKWRQDEGLILVFQNPKLYQILPKSLPEQDWNVEALTQRLREEVGPAA